MMEILLGLIFVALLGIWSHSAEHTKYLKKIEQWTWCIASDHKPKE